MEQYGLVTETGSDTATINLQRHLTCEKCGRCGILSGVDRREMTVEALNPIHARQGQQVVLETDDRQILFLSFMLYLVPLAALLAGIIAGLSVAAFLNLKFNHELFAVGTGLIMMALVFFAIRIWDRRVKDNPKYKPVITGLVKEEINCDAQ
jgi:sigma-E factor negative regulatory protein RseC